ncbi:hypothetical protein llap_1947 [Limosa lapponica baueri]|uniref:Uncharacterized protein n=1 Tax=Limosa lapponica baueri TaxID=1758121 RepID=A0A2I0UNY7_LIMLA|nr:hypothetical protein llap_1947 [Limosa lapponica baueri]
MDLITTIKEELDRNVKVWDTLVCSVDGILEFFPVINMDIHITLAPVVMLETVTVKYQDSQSLSCAARKLMAIKVHAYWVERSGIALLLVLTATSQKLSLPLTPFAEEGLEG